MKSKKLFIILGLLAVVAGGAWYFSSTLAYAAWRTETACRQGDGSAFAAMSLVFKGTGVAPPSSNELRDYNKLDKRSRVCLFTAIDKSSKRPLEPDELKRLGVQDGAVYKTNGGLASQIKFVKWHGRWYPLAPGSAYQAPNQLPAPGAQPVPAPPPAG